jgi:hypothetical protein
VYAVTEVDDDPELGVAGVPDVTAYRVVEAPAGCPMAAPDDGEFDGVTVIPSVIGEDGSRREGRPVRSVLTGPPVVFVAEQTIDEVSARKENTLDPRKQGTCASCGTATATKFGIFCRACCPPQVTTREQAVRLAFGSVFDPSLLENLPPDDEPEVASMLVDRDTLRVYANAASTAGSIRKGIVGGQPPMVACVRAYNDRTYVMVDMMEEDGVVTGVLGFEAVSPDLMPEPDELVAWSEETGYAGVHVRIGPMRMGELAGPPVLFKAEE